MLTRLFRPFHLAPPLFASLLALVLAACTDAVSQQPGPPMPPPAVTVVTLKAAPVTLTRELPGRVSPYLVAEVRPQVGGLIERQLFTEGKRVKAGQPLYQLDNATYQAAYNSAQASLARAQVRLDSARLTANRTTELAKANAVSRQEDEDATAALRQAEADVKVAQAAVETAEVVLQRARVTAPIEGRIGKSSVTQGALVTANQTLPLATIQQLDPIYVDLTQSVAEILQIRKEVAAGNLASTSHLPVTILLEDGSEYAHQGRLAFSDVTVDPATGSTSSRVIVPNPDDLLLPGMYVRAIVSTGRRNNALLAPQQSVTRDPKGNATALIVTAENQVEARQIKVSRTLGDQWLVEAGLHVGDRMIIEGLQKVKPGATVQPTEAGLPPATAANTPLVMPPTAAPQK